MLSSTNFTWSILEYLETHIHYSQLQEITQTGAGTELLKRICPTTNSLRQQNQYP